MIMTDNFLPVQADGYLRSWLLLGPFPGDPRQLLKAPLIAEAGALPAAGKEESGKRWTAVESQASVFDFLPLTPFWKSHTNCCAYAHVYVHAVRPVSAVAALGSDDGAAVWINGRSLFSLDASRPCTPDENRIPVSLIAGWNRILVKIQQYGGGWQFCLRLLTRRGLPVPGLSYSLDRPRLEDHPRGKSRRPPLAMSVCPAETTGETVFLNLTLYNLTSRLITGGKIHIEQEGRPAAIVSCPDLPGGELRQIPIQLPLRYWARAFVFPLRFILEGGKKQVFSISAEASPSLAAAFGAALSTCTGGLPADLRELMGDLHRALGWVENFENSPVFARPAERLTRALVGGNLPAISRQGRALGAAVRADGGKMRGQSVSLIGHAHIDMNWLWRWPETVQVCQATFRQVIRFMAEFPDFRFSQSQASCYDAIERLEPELFAKIRRAVKSGRWNVTGGMWTEGDTNLSSGEALARSFLLGQEYFQSRFGIRARVGWLPDNFGHAAQLPQILQSAGIQYFYHMRTGPREQLYWWEAPDGSRVLTKTGQGYNGAIGPGIRHEPRRLPSGVGHQMFIYGVGDHGGGPTRRDILAARSYQPSPLFPEIKFDTADGYFDAVAPKARGLRIIKGELGYIFRGCYSNVATIKRGNRALENALQAAEGLALAALRQKCPWPERELDEAWKALVFNQFHDILPGSAIHESNDDSRKKYAGGLELALQVRLRSLRFLAEKIALEDGGIPLVVFNPLAWKRSEVVVAEIVVHEDFQRVRLHDAAGAEVPVQIVRTRNFDTEYHVWIQFTAADLPALGYHTYRVRPVTGTANMPIQSWGQPYPGLPELAVAEEGGTLSRRGLRLHNRFLEMEFHPANGRITSLRLRRKGKPGRNLLGAGGANWLGMYLEKPRAMSAWELDLAASGPEMLKPVGPATVVQEGPESISVQCDYTWGRSFFRLLTTLHADTPRIDCKLHVEWLERGGGNQDGPMLRAHWSVAGNPRKLRCDVPFAVVDRKAGHEVPAQKWVDVAAPGGGLAILNRGQYGHSLEGGVVRMTLLRSAYDPDILPDVGIHDIEWAILPHAGDAFDADLPRLGMSYNVPPETFQARAQDGVLPAVYSFLEVEAEPHFVVTGVKRARKGKGIVVRGYDAAGRGAFPVIRLPEPIVSAVEVNLLEEPLPKSPARIKDGRAMVKVGAHRITTLLLDTADSSR